MVSSKITYTQVTLYRLNTDTQQQQQQLKNRKLGHEFERELGRVYEKGLGEGKTKRKMTQFYYNIRKFKKYFKKNLSKC